MNSFVSSMRAAVRTQPPRAFSQALASLRLYSTAPTDAAVASSSSSSSPPSSSSSDSPSPAKTGLDKLMADIKASKPTPRTKGKPQTVHAAFANKGPAHAAAYNSFLSPAAAYNSPFSPAVAPATPDDLWRRQSHVAYSSPVTTTSSRSFVVQNRNVAQAYRLLNRVLQENNVRRELKRQERFESPSNKRVRLNSERHRRRFKVAVGKAVSLAMRMKDL
ncbi:hypothetical protein JCM8547_003077 [Rhodosporidiobolus lusitaniae]